MVCLWSDRQSVTTCRFSSRMRRPSCLWRRSVPTVPCARFFTLRLASGNVAVSVTQVCQQAARLAFGTGRMELGTVAKSQVRKCAVGLTPLVVITFMNILACGPPGSSIRAVSVGGMAGDCSLVAHAATFLGSRLGLFQLGFLHFGQTLGRVICVVRLGTHSWSHLLQMQTKVCPIGIGPPFRGLLLRRRVFVPPLPWSLYQTVKIPMAENSVFILQL